MEEPGSFSGMMSSPRPQRGPEASQRMSLAIFISEAASGFERALGEDEFVMRGERGELVGVRAEGKSGEFGDLLGGAFGEFGMSVESGADGGAADGEIVESVENLLEPLDVALEQAGPAAEFLADGERHGVLKVRAADLDDVVELFGLGFERVAARSGWRG